MTKFMAASRCSGLVNWPSPTSFIPRTPVPWAWIFFACETTWSTSPSSSVSPRSGVSIRTPAWFMRSRAIVQPLVAGECGEPLQAVNRRAVRQDDLLRLGLRQPILNGFGLVRPLRAAQAVHQQDVDVFGIEVPAEAVDLRLSVGDRKS